MAMFLVVSASGAAPPAEGGSAVASAFLLVGTLTLLLGLFALVAILLTRSHHRRQGALRRDRETGPAPDAWEEAGRRLKVPSQEDGGN